MVAAFSAPSSNSRNPSLRPPLIPSEKDNSASSAGPYRRPKAKDVNPRYLSSPSRSSSSTTTTTSFSSASSGTSSSASSSSRRFPSPLLTPRPASRGAPLPTPKRSHSVDRTRPVTGGNVTPPEASSAVKALCTMTRSLSVSFQGESFFYQTSKAKASTPNAARKATPERKRSGTTPLRSGVKNDVRDLVENLRPGDQHHRWPTVARVANQSNLLARSMDCSLDKRDSVFSAVRLLPHAKIFEDGRRGSFDGGDLSASDNESVSSGSNSGLQESRVPAHSRDNPRAISVPARFLQEINSRLRRVPEPRTPSPLPRTRTTVLQKLATTKKLSVDNAMSSPRSVQSPIDGRIRSSSPSKASRAMSSPSRTRSGNTSAGTYLTGQPGSAPSIISFATEVRRAKKGENRIEEAHLLRLLHNRHLQWHFVNARAEAALMVQRLAAEKNLYNAWISTSEIRDSVTFKRIKLSFLAQYLKLNSILKGQMSYLEEWSHMDKAHSSSLSGATEALKASTLRLPVVSGARADVQDVKEAVASAVDVMQAMGSSICSLLSKAESTSSLIAELLKVVAREQAMLDHAREILSTAAALHVKQSSLRGHIMQLKYKGK